MSANISFNIYCMSVHRYKWIKTLKYFEYVTYVVREEEASMYRDVGIENMLVIPKGQVFDFMSTLDWIIKNTPEDVIYVVDDDIERVYHRMEDCVELVDKQGNPDKEKITSEVERIAQLLVDLNLGFATDSPHPQPYAYKSEFQFVGQCGHSRWINKKAYKAKYDPTDPASGDTDIVYQECLHNRVVLIPQYFVIQSPMDKQQGSVVDRQAHVAYVTAMKAKWGKYYDYNWKRNRSRINISR